MQLSLFHCSTACRASASICFANCFSLLLLAHSRFGNSNCHDWNAHRSSMALLRFLQDCDGSPYHWWSCRGCQGVIMLQGVQDMLSITDVTIENILLRSRFIFLSSLLSLSFRTRPSYSVIFTNSCALHLQFVAFHVRKRSKYAS